MQEYKGYPLKLFPEGLQELLLRAWDIQTTANICRQADQYIKNFLEKDMTQFKVGDKVKCIKPKSDVHRDYNLSGEVVYTVTVVSESLDGRPTLFLWGKGLGHKADRFELAKEGHPHAVLMARYAEVAKDHSEPWQFFQFKKITGEWVQLTSNPAWSPYVAYREKPKEVTASLWVAYVVFTDEPEKLHAITAHSKVALEEALAVNVRNTTCRIVKDVHKVTETYEAL